MRYKRHELANRTQQPGESKDQYIQTLKLLAKDCRFTTITADQKEKDSIRKAFISGLSNSANTSKTIRDTYI